MALPDIRYATTLDGVPIAYHVLGQGPAVVMLFPYHVNHLRLNWQVGLHRHAMEYLSRWFKVINLDFRGAGLSQRRIEKLSLDAFCLDIEAVLAELGVDQVAICAMGPGALMGFRFAAGHADQVYAMVLIEAAESEANRRMLAYRHVSPRIEAEMRGAHMGGLDDPENAAALAVLTREATGPDTFAAWESLLVETNILALAAEVHAPALFLHAVDDEMFSESATEALVHSTPNANLITVTAPSGMRIWRDRSALEGIVAFLAGRSGAPMPRVRRARSLDGGPEILSQREIEVLRLLAAGHTNRQISEALYISLNTVSHHLRSIFAKTGSANRTEAARFAHQHDLA